jgi:hypothetical protein
MAEKVCNRTFVTTQRESKAVKNISCVLHKAGLAKFEDRPTPTIGSEDINEAIIRIKYVGVCGSDVRSPAPSRAPLKQFISLTSSGPLLVARWCWK